MAGSVFWRSLYALIFRGASGSCVLLCLILGVRGVSDCNSKVGENEMTACGGSGSFINLCGLCVGGQTGRLETEGLDSCAVCGGDDSCVGCDNVVGSNKISDACGACLGPEDEARDRCTRITSVYPMILDRAVEKVANINLRGAGISPSNLPDITCSLEPTNSQQQGDKAQQFERTSVEDGVIQLEVFLTENLLGLYIVNCKSNTLGPVASNGQVSVLVLDSKELCVTEYKPKNVSVGVEFQMELTIPALSQNSSVLCYVQRKGQQTAEVIQASEVSKGHVKCEPYTAQIASHMEWGAAYTWDAAIDKESCQSPVELIAEAPAPVMQKAYFYDGLQKIRIEFDHNVDGSEKCADIFAPDTLLLLGDDANCSYVANSLVVTLGSNVKLQMTSELQLLDNSKVFREQSDPSLTAPAMGKVTLTVPDTQTSSPQFEVEAPKFICPDSQQGSALGRSYAAVNTPSVSSGASPPHVIRIISPGEQKLEYNWTVEYSATPKDQRYNLMIWRSVRMFQTYLKRASKSLQNSQISINTSMLMPDIEYKISVNGINLLGVQGETKHFSFQVIPATKRSDSEDQMSSSQLVLKGPATTLSNAASYIEATVISCDPQIILPTMNYQWRIEGELAQQMELSRGKMLSLHRGILQGGKVYNISCTCMSESNDSAGMFNANAWHALQVLFQGIMARITKQEMVLGTGQMLQLDASQSQDLDRPPGKLQYSWCCRQEAGGRCLLPRAGEPIILESAFNDAFQKPVLTLPPGSLPVGRYIFTVEVSKPGVGPSQAQSVVVVVPGMPALVNVPAGAQMKLVNPKEGVTIPAVVTNIHEGCHMWWSVQQDPGLEYFNLAEVVGLGDTVVVTLEEANDILGREFPLVIPGPTGTWPGLKDNAVYKLRLSVVCPLEPATSYADFLITTNSPPTVKSLKVIPAKGEALRTRFVFSTDVADDSYADYPLLYKYGYQISDEEKIHIFGMSNVDLQATTTLPAVTGPETVIFPVLTVCDVHELCTSITGEPVTINLPSDLTLIEVQQVGVQFADYVATERYPEAMSVAQTSLQTLKQLQNQTLYTAGAEIIENTIRQAFKIKQNDLVMKSGSLQSSLDFLDMSITVLQELPMSGSTLQDLSALKDKILSVAKGSGELRLTYNQSPERLSISKKQSRQRRSSEDTQKITTLSLSNVKTLLQASEFLINTGNSSVVLAEKQKLLHDLHTYMINLCVAKDDKISVGATTVHLSAQKLRYRDHIKTTNFNVPDRTKFPPSINETGLINLGRSVADIFDSSAKMCLGGAVIRSDYLTDVATGSDKSSVKAQKRNSAVFEVQIVTAEDKVAVGKLDYPVIVKIPVDTTSLDAGQVLQCATWKERMWSGDSCVTGEYFNVSTQTYLTCTCNVLGYYMVLVVNASTITTPPISTTVVNSVEITSAMKTMMSTFSTDSTSISMQDTSSAITAVPDMTHTISCKDLLSSDRQEGVPISNETYSISFRIEEDFNSTVGKQKEKFKQNLQCEILAQVSIQIPRRMIQDISISPGSIMVTVRLVDTDVMTAKEVIPVIALALQNGDLNLHDLDNRKLNVPPQSLTIIEPYRPEKSSVVLYAVVGSVLVSTLGIISLVAGAVIVKRKKESDRMRKQLIPSVTFGVPLYRQFQFEHSLEGTEASLARYRSNYPTLGTAGTLLTGLNFESSLGNRAGVRHGNQMVKSQYLHPDINCSTSKASGRKKKKKEQKGVEGAGSLGGMLNGEATPSGDQDSGIVDGCTNVPDDRNTRQRTRDKKHSNDSAMEFDILPGTPTEDQ